MSERPVRQDGCAQNDNRQEQHQAELGNPASHHLTPRTRVFASVHGLTLTARRPGRSARPAAPEGTGLLILDSG